MAPPRPHLLARAPLVDRLGAGLQGAWDRGWLAPIALGPSSLWQHGAKGFGAGDEAGGRSEEDCADFRLRLEQISAAVESEARLNPVGRAAAWGQLTRAVRQRHALGRLWRSRPDLLDTEIAAPILVVGQMRGGTTRIHRLLAADPRHAATRFCDSWHPVPPTKDFGPDLRPAWSGMALFWARRLNPWLDTIHPFGAARTDEELGWLAGALDHCAYEAQWHIPSFVAFSEARGAAPIYREFARILRTDAAHRGNASQPRVMKIPQFAEDLAELLAAFPDARVVLAERDPEETVQSAVSLVANQMAMQSEHADLAVIEAEWRRKCALRKARMEEALAGFAGPVARVDFAALDADWEGAVGALYAGLGIALTPAALAAMRREQASFPHQTSARRPAQMVQSPST